MAQTMTQTVPTIALSNMAIALKDKTIERANLIAERTGSLEIGLAKALLIEQLEAKLADNQLCRIIFVKRDGSLREMFCSTNPSLCSKHVKGVSREHFGTKVVFDVEKGEFRSFRLESIVKVY
jgi:hypothetical protein